MTPDRPPCSMNPSMTMNDAAFPILPFGLRLGTRSEGEGARAELLAALLAISEPGRLTVDLSGVDVLSGSFADEAVAIPCSRLVAGECGDRYLLVRAPHADLVDDLAHKLERRRLAMLCRIDDGWTVLGALPPPMHETLRLVAERRETTAKELADALDIRHNACLHRVGRLADLRLLRREVVGVIGPHPTYRLSSILPTDLRPLLDVRFGRG